MTTYVLLLVGTHAAAVALGMGIARGRLVRARQDDALALARAAGVVPARSTDRGGVGGLFLLVVLVVAVLVALIASLLSQALGPLQDRYPCPTPTAASCTDGPGTSS